MPRFSTTSQNLNNRGMYSYKTLCCCCLDSAGVYSFTVPSYCSPSSKLGIPGMIVCVVGAGGGGASGTSYVDSSCSGNGNNGTAGGGSCFGVVTAAGGGAGCRLPFRGSDVGVITSNVAFACPFCCWGWSVAGYAPPASYSGCFSSATSGATFPGRWLDPLTTCCIPYAGISAGGPVALLCIYIGVGLVGTQLAYLSTCACCHGAPTDGCHFNTLQSALGVITNGNSTFYPSGYGFYRGCGGTAGTGVGCFQGGTNVSTSSIMVGAPGGNGAVAIKYYYPGDLTPTSGVCVCVGTGGTGGNGWPDLDTRTTLGSPCFHYWPQTLGISPAIPSCYNSFYTRGISGNSGTVIIKYHV